MVGIFLIYLHIVVAMLLVVVESRRCDVVTIFTVLNGICLLYTSLLMNGKAEAVGLIGTQNAKSYFGTDAVDADEQHEEVIFILSGKAIEENGVFADAHIGIEQGLLTDNQRVQRRSRRIGPIADTVDVDKAGIRKNMADNAFYRCV